MEQQDGEVEPTAVGSRAESDVEATVAVDRSSIGQWSLVLEDGRTFDLWATSVVVGRHPRQPNPGVQTLAIPDQAQSLSKTHARLDLVDGTWQVTDLGSTNGVVVAGADGQDAEVVRGGTAPVHGYLELGALRARMVPTVQADGTLPPARQSGATEPSGLPVTSDDAVETPEVVGSSVETTEADQDEQVAAPVGAHENLQRLLNGLQPPWLKMPQVCADRLLEECGGDVEDVEDLLRRQVERRFRFLTHPPRWLQEEYWPVGRHGPLVFVEQVDAVPDRPGTAVNYVFVDPRNGAFLVLPQVQPGPAAEDAEPEGQSLRGVVPVASRPGAFWLTPPDARRRPAAGGSVGGRSRGDGPGVAGPGGDAPADSTDATAEGPRAVVDAEPPSAPPQPSAPRAEPVRSTAGSVNASVPADRPAVDEVPVLVAPAPVPTPRQQTTAELPPAQPVAVPPVPAVPATVPVEPPDSVGLATLEPSETDDVEATVTKDPPSFLPWTLALADGRTFAVESRSVVVGRRPQTDEPGVQVLAVVDSTRSLSKTHARLDLMGDTWHVTDLGSTNGVVVTTADGQETEVEPGRSAPVYGYVAFGSVEARLQPDPTG